MKKAVILFAVLFLLFITVRAEGGKTYTLPIEFSIFNNGTFMPGKGVLGIWSPTVHPGFHIGTRFYYRQKESYQLYQTAKLGYFYHQYAQHGIQLFSELTYRYHIRTQWYAEAGLGVGYLHSVPSLEVFNFNNGQYDKQTWKGRHQLMGSMGIHIGHKLSAYSKLPLEIFAGYQFWVQSPFVNKYVPVLPNNAVHLGFVYYMITSKKAS